MCMALPGGSQHEAPRSRLQQLMQWLGFAGLLGRVVGIGICQWISHCLFEREPNTSRTPAAETRSRAG